jgi:GNAT superfamily N-acetyltransferase
VDFEVRRAGPADADDIAAAHIDSIRSVGPRFYDADTVRAWHAHLTSALHANAMARGEEFFVAVGRLAGPSDVVLGFSSHRVDGTVHGTAVYIRGDATRRGIGSALFKAAERAAIAAGATTLEIDSSLAAVEFYATLGFEKTGRGTHALSSGHSMACVFMRKSLRSHGD